MDYQCRCKNIIQDLHYRQLCPKNSRSVGLRILRRMLVGTTPIRYMWTKKFKPGYFDISDSLVVARSASHNDYYAYQLRTDRSEPWKDELRPVFRIPSSNNEQSVGVYHAGKRNLMTLVYEQTYPYRKDVPNDDYLPALMVLVHNVLYRYDLTTFRMLSRHSLSFTQRKMISLDLSKKLDCLIITSTVSNPDSNSRSQMVFVVFNLHPFSLRCTLSISTNEFPNKRDQQLYGKGVSIDTDRNMLLVGTSRKYTLVYDCSKFINLATRTQETIVMEGLPLLMALPSISDNVRVEEQSGHYLALYGDHSRNIRITSLDSVISYMSMMSHTSPAIDSPSCVGCDDINSFVTQYTDSLLTLDGDNSLEEQELPHELNCDSKDVLLGRTPQRTHMMKLCGEYAMVRSKVLDENNCEVVAAFFPGYFSRMIHHTISQIMIYHLPLGKYKEKSDSLIGRLELHYSVRPEPEEAREPFTVTRSGRVVAMKYADSMWDKTDRALTYACCLELGLFMIIVVEEEPSSKPSYVQLVSLRIYDIYSLQLLRVVPLRQRVELEGFLIVNYEHLKLAIQGDKILVFNMCRDFIQVSCFQVRHLLPGRVKSSSLVRKRRKISGRRINRRN